MLPAGGVKGAMLALLVELVVVGLTGARFGFEADSFFVATGNRPRIGQVFIAVDPDALAGTSVYLARVEALVATLLAEDGVRLPGTRRREQALRAGVDGVEIGDPLLAQLRRLATG